MGSFLEVILEPILDHFWIHLGTLGDLGGSKWTSKGSWKMFWRLSKSRPWKNNRKSDFGGSPGRHIAYLGPVLEGVLETVQV